VATFTNLLNRNPPSFSRQNDSRIPLSHAILVQEVTEGCESRPSATLLCEVNNEGDDEDPVDALLAEFPFIPAVWRSPIPPTNSPLSTSSRKDMADLSWRTYSREAFCFSAVQSSSSHSALDVEGEDNEEPSSPSPSLDKRDMFQRLDSKPNLDKDRADALLPKPNSHATRRTCKSSSNSPLGISPSKLNAQERVGGSLEEKVDLANHVATKDELQDRETDSQDDFPLPMEYRRADGTRCHRDGVTKGSWEVLEASSDTSSSKEVDGFEIMREKSHRSDISNTSPPYASPDTVDTELSSTGIVRGFSKDHISSSARARVQLAPSQSAQPNNSIFTRTQPPSKRNTATFMLGGSSGEGDERPLESRFLATSSSLAAAPKTVGGKPESKKTTSFNEKIATRTIQDRPYESEEVFEDTDDEDEDQSESAIEVNDVDEEWEDDDESSSFPSFNEKGMSLRVDSTPNLVSQA
jgi:hypothetical protein